MKQTQMVFAVLVTVLLLIAGALLTPIAEDAGWKLMLSGCLLATLCFVQSAFSRKSIADSSELVSIAQNSHEH